VTDEIVATGVGQTQAMLSPDLNYLIFESNESKARLKLMDLQTMEVKVISGSPTSCFSWSPDSKRFSTFLYTTKTGLYVFDLSGNSQLIYAPPESYYGTTIDPFGKSGARHGEVTCGVWIGGEHLLFQRFTGELPKTVTRPGFPELDSNTTTMAEVGNSVRLLDSPQRWYEVDACKAG
jgi:hypothetical protein